MTTALNQAEAICQEQGLRFTALRRRVLAMVWENHGPAKAYDILDKLQAENHSARPPTVYRALDFLQEHGLVHKLNRLNAYVGCSHPLQHTECYFLICSQCGTIEECCNDALKQAILSITTQHQFTPAHTTLEIEGICRECTN
ncbi:MAG: transcriptional repressor [Rickettsiales bacterium]|nr:transcriptional repressor [Rickettsiales bacterium]